MSAFYSLYECSHFTFKSIDRNRCRWCQRTNFICSLNTLKLCSFYVNNERKNPNLITNIHKRAHTQKLYQYIRNESKRYINTRHTFPNRFFVCYFSPILIRNALLFSTFEIKSLPLSIQSHLENAFSRKNYTQCWKFTIFKYFSKYMIEDFNFVIRFTIFIRILSRCFCKSLTWSLTSVNSRQCFHSPFVVQIHRLQKFLKLIHFLRMLFTKFPSLQ